MIALAVLAKWLAVRMNDWRDAHPVERDPLASHFTLITYGASFVLGVACLWLFAPRILGRPYRGFRLVARAESAEAMPRLSLSLSGRNCGSSCGGVSSPAG